MKKTLLIILAVFIVSGCASNQTNPNITGLMYCKLLPDRPMPGHPNIAMVYLNCKKAPEGQNPPKPKPPGNPPEPATHKIVTL